MVSQPLLGRKWNSGLSVRSSAPTSQVPASSRGKQGLSQAGPHRGEEALAQSPWLCIPGPGNPGKKEGCRAACTCWDRPKGPLPGTGRGGWAAPTDKSHALHKFLVSEEY